MINDPESATVAATWTADLPGERARLVRLCARLTGSYEAAEDLAQETLFEAWRQAPKLRDEAVWRSFVFGIARNVCLRWLRSHGREMSRRAREVSEGASEGEPGYAPWDAETAPDPFDVEEALEARERAALIDRALRSLSEDTRRLLQERYVEELPQAEIAIRHGMTENAIGVRIHRAKAALRRAVAADPDLSVEAAAYGLIADDEVAGAVLAAWQESRIWCPRCGRRHLEARFVREADGTTRAEATATPDNVSSPLFGVRCPDCQHGLGFEFTSAHPALDTRRLLRGVSGYKPALNRLHAWWADYYDRAVSDAVAACPICGSPADVTTTAPGDADPRLQGMRGLFLHCRRCRKTCCTTPSGIAFHRPEAQAFWRRHPRVALRGERETVLEGRDAIAVMLESRTDSARLEVFLDRATFATLTARQTDA
jgi:RNA polymerase sigma-70 factor (ECF subfamily)